MPPIFVNGTMDVKKFPKSLLYSSRLLNYPSLSSLTKRSSTPFSLDPTLTCNSSAVHARNPSTEAGST